MDKLCRICLGEEANIPIFERNEDGSNLNSKLSLCVREKVRQLYRSKTHFTIYNVVSYCVCVGRPPTRWKTLDIWMREAQGRLLWQSLREVEDIEGYPRNICKACSRTLDSVCLFINKYQESNKILESGLVPLKLEKVFNESCNDYSDAEIELVEIKKEPEIVFENVNTCVFEPLEAKLVNLKHLSIKRVGSKKSVSKKKSNIAESILEGDFKGNGESDKTVKSKKRSTKKEVKTKKTNFKLVKKQIELKKRRIKKENIVKPVKETSNEPKPPKLCDLCGAVFPTSDQLAYHKKKTHIDVPVQCPTCGRTCASTYYLNRHIKRKHSNDKEFVCAVCGKGFAFKGELSTHYSKVHVKKTGPPPSFSCKICGKTYKCRKSVVVHERAIHTGERPAVCKICNTSFTHDDYLKEHMRLHTGETPFKCPICGRGYAQRCNMKSHLRIHRVSELDAAALSALRPNYLRRLKV